MRNIEYDLVTLVRGVEDTNRVNVVTNETAKEFAWLLEQAAELAKWDGQERREVERRINHQRGE